MNCVFALLGKITQAIKSRTAAPTTTIISQSEFFKRIPELVLYSMILLLLVQLYFAANQAALPISV